MSNIKDLIAELCPNGVEFKTLSEIIISLRTGLNPRKFFKLNTPDARNFYITIREIHNGKILPDDKTNLINNEALILCNNRSKLEIGDILFSGTGTIGETAVIEETPKNWNIKEGVYSIKPISEIVNSKFLMYALQTKEIRQKIFSKVEGGTVKSISMDKLKQVKIPIPPLPVQAEIVRILDTFTELISELTAELSMRKKQYEYYRDKLLTFEGVEYKPLGEICTIKARIGWQRLTKAEYLESGDYYLITGVDIMKNHRIDFKSCHYVSKERYEMDLNIQLREGDIIVTKDGTIGKVAIIENLDKPAVLNSHLFVIRDNSKSLNNKFLMYYLLSNYFKDFFEKHKTTGTISGLNQEVIKKFEIPIPPLAEQERIVNILDKFDKLCNDLSEGIPAEIALRKKQYEYYRDKLLTFKELESATI